MQKIIFRILFFSALLLLFGSFPAWTQISSGLPSNMSGPVPDLSPNAEAARNVNVDLFHGVAHISIPLYHVKNRNASVSISLNYTPSTKSDDVVYYPGWTGLGWNLSAGGAIVRTVRGVRDESVTVNGLAIWPNSLQWNQYDPHEDLFIFNFCGYSGKFFYHKGKWIVFDTETPNISISISTVGGHLGGPQKEIKGFRLLFPNGFAYTFGSIEDFVGNPVESSAWYLTKIESPEGDCLYFNYEQENNCIPRPVYNCTQYYAVYQSNNGGYIQPNNIYNKTIPDSLSTPNSPYNNSYASTSPIFLRSITGGPVTVLFNRSVATEKAPPPPIPPAVSVTSYQLNEIVLVNEETQQSFKKYQLTYTNNAAQTLKLLSVKEQGVKADNSIVSKPPYILNYITEYVNAGGPCITLLQKMTYPTGGYTTFEYEYCQPDNVTYRMNVPHLYSVYNKQYSFRIKYIRSYGDTNEVPSVTAYSYNNAVRSRFKIVYSNFFVNMPYNYTLQGHKASNYDQYIPEGYFVGKPGFPNAYQYNINP